MMVCRLVALAFLGCGWVSAGAMGSCIFVRLGAGGVGVGCASCALGSRGAGLLVGLLMGCCVVFIFLPGWLLLCVVLVRVGGALAGMGRVLMCSAVRCTSSGWTLWYVCIGLGYILSDCLTSHSV
jgi:hypothetical protein